MSSPRDDILVRLGDDEVHPGLETHLSNGPGQGGARPKGRGRRFVRGRRRKRTSARAAGKTARAARGVVAVARAVPAGVIVVVVVGGVAVARLLRDSSFATTGAEVSAAIHTPKARAAAYARGQISNDLNRRTLARHNRARVAAGDDPVIPDALRDIFEIHKEQRLPAEIGQDIINADGALNPVGSYPEQVLENMRQKISSHQKTGRAEVRGTNAGRKAARVWRKNREGSEEHK